MITYEDFITELGHLAVAAKKLRSAETMHEDTGFRKWRNQLEGILNQITSQGYLLPCPCRVHHRAFSFTPNNVTFDEQRDSYQMEVDDTINEIEFIVESYENYGEPQKGGQSTDQGLDSEKITLSWLFHNAHISLWVWVVGVLFTVLGVALGIGIAIGQSKFYQEYVAPIFAG